MIVWTKKTNMKLDSLIRKFIFYFIIIRCYPFDNFFIVGFCKYMVILDYKYLKIKIVNLENHLTKIKLQDKKRPTWYRGAECLSVCHSRYDRARSATYRRSQLLAQISTGLIAGRLNFLAM